jgi:hypothetical protein
MTRRKREIPILGAINPDQLYRTTLSVAIFNLGWQATKNKIKGGELPRPSPIFEGSKYEAWTGQQILDHRRDMRALAEQKAAIDAARPKQSQPAAFKRKKLKLRTSPSPLRSRKSQSQSA